MKPIIYTFFVSMWLLLSPNSQANNIALSNLTTNYNASTGVVTAEFDLSWENSWRSAATGNWDAAWVFFKFEVNDLWLHLNVTGNDISLPTGYTYSVPADKKGIFIYRDANGTGNVSLTDCIVGLKPAMGSFDVKAFALEMVMVPEGAFYVGSGGTWSNYNYLKNGDDNGPYYVSTLASGITKGTGSSTYLSCYFDGSLRNSYPLGTDYPTGYLGFYIMKYELSNGAMRDFLNTVSYSWHYGNNMSSKNVGDPVFAQGPNRVLRVKTKGTSISNPFVMGCDKDNDGIFDESSDGEWTACNGINTATFIQYLDWAALRPMTAMEYEKACRGTDYPVNDEFAWATNFVISTGTPTVVNAFTSSEAITGSITYNCLLDSGTSNQIRPIRSGACARSTTNRYTSGASFWGVMDLTGNLWEIVVNIHDEEAVEYDGSHGDGNPYPLTSPSWPDDISGSGYLLKGGSYKTTLLANYAIVSGAGTTYPAFWTYNKEYGIRGVRTLE